MLHAALKNSRSNLAPEEEASWENSTSFCVHVSVVCFCTHAPDPPVHFQQNRYLNQYCRQPLIKLPPPLNRSQLNTCALDQNLFKGCSWFSNLTEVSVVKSFHSFMCALPWKPAYINSCSLLFMCARVQSEVNSITTSKCTNIHHRCPAPAIDSTY